VDGEGEPVLANEGLARFLLLSSCEGALETTGGMEPYDPDGRGLLGETTARGEAVPRDGDALSSGPHGGDGRRTAGTRHDGPRAALGRHHAPEDCWGRYSATEVEERRRLARQLFATLAASSPDGLLRPPALQRLGNLAGYDLPTYAVSWAGDGLDPDDEEDVASLMDFLDSAEGFHFCNGRLGGALRRLSERSDPGIAAQGPAAGTMSPSSGAVPTTTTPGPAPAQPVGEAPRPAAASVTRSFRATEAGATGDASGPSGRRWDYSRFDTIRDSSDDEMGPGR